MTRRGTRSARRGVAAIEFGLTLPFLLFVVLGVVELGALMHRAHVMSRVALDACRTASSVIEGIEPTGDQIEDAAIVEARFALQAAGVDCQGQCMVTADWHRVNSKWMMLTVTVDAPYNAVSGYLPMIPRMSHGAFTMVTQQQRLAD